MKLVIDIPEDVYKKTVFYREFRDLNDCVTTIKALENGTPLEECEDCISRQAAIDAIKGWETVPVKVLELFPSVKPTEKVWDWIPANQPPKASGRYIVTRHFFNDDFVEMASYATNLHKVDNYDFPKRKAGWYNYDSEYGHYEVDDVVAWMPIEPYKASPTGAESEE